MTAKERVRHEISEAFDFLRFVIKNPKEMKNIRNGSEINIVCKDVPARRSRKSAPRRSQSPQSSYISQHTFFRI